MWLHYMFKDGSNPYISTTNDKAFNVLSRSSFDFYAPNMVTVYQMHAAPKGYQERKEAVRNIAIRWAQSFADFDISYFTLAEWENFFEKYGRKYGLLREFRENGIC